MTTRSDWTDKFKTPTRDGLLAPLEAQPLVALAADAMSPGTDESIVWLGVPWRWTLRYTNPDSKADRIVYLVPDPETPRLATAFDAETLTRIDLKSQHRFLRDGLASANRVGDRVWTEWPFTSKAQVGELTSYLRSAVLGINE